jgi:hypothetical protein
VIEDHAALSVHTAAAVAHFLGHGHGRGRGHGHGHGHGHGRGHGHAVRAGNQLAPIWGHALTAPAPAVAIPATRKGLGTRPRSVRRASCFSSQAPDHARAPWPPTIRRWATGRRRRRAVPTLAPRIGRRQGCGCHARVRVVRPIDRGRAPTFHHAAARFRCRGGSRRVRARLATVTDRPRSRTTPRDLGLRASPFGARRQCSCRGAVRSKGDPSPLGTGPREVLVAANVRHLGQKGFQRAPVRSQKRFLKDLSMLGLSGAVVLGSAPPERRHERTR